MSRAPTSPGTLRVSPWVASRLAGHDPLSPKTRYFRPIAVGDRRADDTLGPLVWRGPGPRQFRPDDLLWGFRAASATPRRSNPTPGAVGDRLPSPSATKPLSSLVRRRAVGRGRPRDRRNVLCDRRESGRPVTTRRGWFAAGRFRRARRCSPLAGGGGSRETWRRRGGFRADTRGAAGEDQALIPRRRSSESRSVS